MLKKKIFVTLLFGLLAVSVNANNLIGMCVDMGEPGCQGRYIPFNEASISWCEESCTLSNPVNITDMNAILYKYTCKSDHAGIQSSRVMVLTQEGWNGIKEKYFVSNKETLPIVPCQ